MRISYTLTRRAKASLAVHLAGASTAGGGTAPAMHADGAGRLVGLEEKPKLRYTVSMGVYAFDPGMRDLIAPGESIDFPDLLWRAVEAGHPVDTHPFEGYWRDIGNPDDYEQAIADFAEDPGRFIAAADGGQGAQPAGAGGG
jgi:NDP-sugar pyrophosphorylase family protein